MLTFILLAEVYLSLDLLEPLQNVEIVPQRTPPSKDKCLLFDKEQLSSEMVEGK